MSPEGGRGGGRRTGLVPRGQAVLGNASQLGRGSIRSSLHVLPMPKTILNHFVQVLEKSLTIINLPVFSFYQIAEHLVCLILRDCKYSNGKDMSAFWKYELNSLPLLGIATSFLPSSLPQPLDSDSFMGRLSSVLHSSAFYSPPSVRNIVPAQ